MVEEKLEGVDRAEARRCFEEGVRAYHRGEEFIPIGIEYFSKLEDFGNIGLAEDQLKNNLFRLDQLRGWEMRKDHLDQAVIQSLGWSSTPVGNQKNIGVPERVENEHRFLADVGRWRELSRTGDAESKMKLYIAFILVYDFANRAYGSLNQQQFVHISTRQPQAIRELPRLSLMAQVLSEDANILGTDSDQLPQQMRLFQRAQMNTLKFYEDRLRTIDSPYSPISESEKNANRLIFAIGMFRSASSLLPSLRADNTLDDQPNPQETISSKINLMWRDLKSRPQERGEPSWENQIRSALGNDAFVLSILSGN